MLILKHYANILGKYFERQHLKIFSTYAYEVSGESDVKKEVDLATGRPPEIVTAACACIS